MTDQLTNFVEKKLTHNQKRGLAAGRASNLEFHNDRRTADYVAERSPEQLQAAQRGLADMALVQEDPEAWLRDVLSALGLLRHVVPPAEGFRTACYPHAGTKRGYEIHLRSYTKPCNMCDAVARAAETERLRRMGVTMEESGAWTIC